MVIGGVERSMPMGLLDPRLHAHGGAHGRPLQPRFSGSVYYHALWSLGLILLAMSLIFILIIHLIGRKGRRPMASEKNGRSVALDAHVRRIDSQDKVATGVLTVIVGLVMLLVVAIIAYILVRGAGRALTPGFLTNPLQRRGRPRHPLPAVGLVLHAARDAYHLGAHLAGRGDLPR